MYDDFEHSWLGGLTSWRGVGVWRLSWLSRESTPSGVGLMVRYGQGAEICATTHCVRRDVELQ